MPDLQLKHITIRNWERVKSAHLEFPAQGLILVIGSNLASGGKLQSVGSGKTSLGEALSRTLTGVRGRFTDLGHYAPDFNPKDTYVQVGAELLGKPLVVEMGYKCAELAATDSGLAFTYQGQRICRGHVDQTRLELSRALRISPELAAWTVFLEGKRLNFSKLPQQEAVNMLLAALAQPPWTDYSERANKLALAGWRQVEVARQALEASKMRLANLNADLREAQEDHQEAVEEHSTQAAQFKERLKQLRIQNHNDRNAAQAGEEAIKKAKQCMKHLENTIAQLSHEIEVKRQTLRDSLALKEVEYNEAVADHSACQTRQEQAQETLTEMQSVPKNCPTCGKTWDAQHSASELSKAEAKVKSESQALQVAEQRCEKIRKQKEALTDQIAKLTNQLKIKAHRDEIGTLNEQVTKNDRMIHRLNAEIHQRDLHIAHYERGPDAQEVNKRLAIVEERERATQGEKTRVAGAAEDLAGEEEMLKVLTYWQKAFGPAGIPNMILSEAIAPLNRIAQRISNLMTGGTLKVSYETRRELASGDTKAQLVIRVDNLIGSKRPEGSSNGEAGLTNLIIAENLSEIGQVSQRIGFRWYDEITTGQDTQVRRSIFAYLKELAHRLGILIFVVDHHIEAASYADYVLLAEKTRTEGTVYRWQ
jgi:DNA repair exonuclease SbcCD ATPase subunit